MGLVALALTVLSALWLARRISAPFVALADTAAALGSGERMPPIRSRLREANIVTDALVASAATLAERTRQRDAAEEELRTLNARLEAALGDETKQRKATQQQLAHALKTEAVGQLTGGIAHDFNNMLSVILASLRLLERRLRSGKGDHREFLASAVEAAERAAQLTQRLLAFARQQPLVPQTLDANKLVASVSDLLRRTIPETVQIETVLAGGLWQTHVDPNQIESALINLAINARDAMPDGGKLTLETANAHLDDVYAREHVDVASGQYVMIAVSDTGIGMASEVAERAFDPFFTTKPVGQGTGLGLSQVHGFVKQSGGHIKIYSEVGQGTTVKVYLPRALPGVAATPSREAAVAVVPAASTNALVLVVEDDPRVRHITVEMLRELGYPALAADGARAALDIVDENPDVAVLFTDVVMPDMNGRQLAEEALRRAPRLKVLFTTGYTRNAIVHNNVLDPGVNFIAKPFTMETLALKLQALLIDPMR